MKLSSPKSQLAILALGDGAGSLLGVVRSLGRYGLAVHVAGCSADCVTLFSRYIAKTHSVNSVMPDDPNWPELIRDVCRRNDISMIIPCDDPHVILLQKYQVELSDLARLYTLPELAFEVTFDKIKTVDLARSLGVPIPNSVVLTSEAELDSAYAEIGCPAVVKPPSSYTARDLSRRSNVAIVDNPTDFIRRVTELLPNGPVLVQRFFPGTTASLSVLARDGDVLTAFQHVAIREYGGGSSYRTSVPPNAEMLDAARKIVSALDYTGIAMLQCQLDTSSGQWVLLEVNGRFVASLPFAVASGANLPRYLYEMLALGQEAFPTQYRTGIYGRNLLLDIGFFVARWRESAKPRHLYSCFHDLMKELSNVILLKERMDVFVFDDPMPGLAELWRLVRLLPVVIETKWLPPLSRRRQKARFRKLSARIRSILLLSGNDFCRAAFAAAVARAALPSEIQLESAGFFSVSEQECPAEVSAAAADFGIDLSLHRSSVVNRNAIQQADVILIFELDDLFRLFFRYPTALRKAFFVGAFQSARDILIRNPTKYPEAVFVSGLKTIADSAKQIAGILAETR